MSTALRLAARWRTQLREYVGGPAEALNQFMFMVFTMNHGASPIPSLLHMSYSQGSSGAADTVPFVWRVI